MRVKKITNPGRAGIITDVPAIDIPHEASTFAQDVIFPNGYMRQRRGWTYLSAASPSYASGNGPTGAEVGGVFRARFLKQNATRTLICLKGNGGVFEATSPTTWSSQMNPFASYGLGTMYPRCMYNDQLIFVDVSGISPIPTLKYSGAAIASSQSFMFYNGTLSYTVNEATLTSAATGFSFAMTSGYYYNGLIGTQAGGVGVTYPMIEEFNSQLSVTMQGWKASSTANSFSNGYALLMSPLPACVSIYSAGTVSGTVPITGAGTKWLSPILNPFLNGFGGDYILVNDAGTFRMMDVNGSGAAGLGTPNSDTSISTAFTGAYTKSSYDFLRPPRFGDVASHKGSFWGAGIPQFQNRVYVAPPGWNLGSYPGATLPYDPQAAVNSTTKSFFLMDFIDVPAAQDGDPVVAILSSPDSLWVLKRKSIHGIYGSYPNFSQGVIAHGIGCIDMRSAISVDEGLFWAAEQGIHWSPDGRQVIPLMKDKIEREWRALVTNGIEYVVTGVTFGYLVVSVKSGDGTRRTWAYNLRTGAWECRLSDTNPRAMYSAKVAGEPEQLIAYIDSIPDSPSTGGRLVNFRPMFDGTGGVTDASGAAPVMWYRSGSVTGTPTDAEPESKMLDLEVLHNLRGQDNLTTADVRVAVQGGVGASGVFTFGTSTFNGLDTFGPAAGKAAGSLSSHTYDGVERNEFTVNRSGRQHFIEIKGNVLSGTNDSMEIHELAMSFRDRRGRV